MKYYLDKIEQVKTETEGKYNEYGSRTKYEDYDGALTKFYETLMNISNSTQHVFLDIRIVNSEGGCVKKDFIGAYIETE